MRVKLHAIQPGPVDKAGLVERAARICYKSEMSETREAQTKFLASLFGKSHTSVAEHARYTKEFHGVDVYELFWDWRYGASITKRHNYFVVSYNARHDLEQMYPLNVLLDPDCDAGYLEYTDLSLDEKIAHASASFELSGISRACSHQLVRHRVFSFSQESQRYCDSGDWEPVVPPSIATSEGAMQVFHYAMFGAKEAYRCLRRDWGIPKQDARFLLPNATPTRLMMTGTFEHWVHFLKLRLDKSAQWEIRGVAREILNQLIEIEPEIFEELKNA